MSYKRNTLLWPVGNRYAVQRMTHIQRSERHTRLLGDDGTWNISAATNP